ncbi:MAG TPA: hypothetical protein V6C81_13570 [Planktothrix sp.]|jgi:hypothetical protein
MLSLITVAALVVLAATIIVALGTAVGHLTGRRFGADGMFARILSYSNLLLWLSPIVGFFTSAATLAVANQSMNSARKMRVMAAICMIASLANFFAGMVLLQNHTI